MLVLSKINHLTSNLTSNPPILTFHDSTSPEDFNLLGKSKDADLSRDVAPKSKARKSNRQEKAGTNGPRDSDKQERSRCPNATVRKRKEGVEVVDLTEEREGEATTNSTEEEHGGRTLLGKRNRRIPGKSECSVASQPRRVITIDLSTDSEEDESSSDYESSAASSPLVERHASKEPRVNEDSAESLAEESSRKKKGTPSEPGGGESLSSMSIDGGDSSDESDEGEGEDFIPLVRPAAARDLSGGPTVDSASNKPSLDEWASLTSHTPMGLHQEGLAADVLAPGVVARSQDK